MPRGSRRGGRRSLEIDSLEGRSLLSQFGWPMSPSPGGIPIVVAFTPAPMPLVEHLREPMAGPFAVDPGLMGGTPGGEFPVAYRSMRLGLSDQGFSGVVIGGGPHMMLTPGPEVGLGIPILKELPFSPGAFEPAGEASRMVPPGGRPRSSGPIFRFPRFGTVHRGRLTHRSEHPCRTGSTRHRLAAIRPDPGAGVPERSSNPPQNGVEGIATLAAPEALAARLPSLPNQAVGGFLSAVAAGMGQRVVGTLVALPLVQPGASAPQPSASATPVPGSPLVEAAHAPATVPVSQPEPLPSEAPSPQGADLITRFSPFELTPIEESFSRLVERIVSLDGIEELEANDATPVLLVVAAVAAFEAAALVAEAPSRRRLPGDPGWSADPPCIIRSDDATRHGQEIA